MKEYAHLNCAERAIAQLNDLTDGDPETAHAMADEILCGYLKSIRHDAVANAFERASKRIGFWYA